MNVLQIKANSKINLALAVKFKREDDYHELELIYQEIDFYDTLYLEKNSDIIFTTTSPVLGPAEENLCVKAARLMQKEFGIGGLKIHLDKQIPVGGGLGGGSSDAAAVLKGGLRLYERIVPEKKLLRLAAALGSDVPFFLKGKTAYGTGKGEKIKPIRLYPDYRILLILPPFKISTAWAYKNLNLALTSRYTDYKFKGFRFQNLALVEFKTEFFNDFEKSVFNSYPALASIKSQLYENGAQFAAMSGSGAVMFGLFDSEKSLGIAHEAMRGQYDCRTARPVQGDDQE
jgi:4-diphosphocytidyl-2-C-methyl-D-erythritol kinase